MAREVLADAKRGNRFSPALTPDELAFYDAVSQNESAVNAMGCDG
jgi:type I restriction enzyme R subunit